jgi:hypothetical protein
MNMKPFETFFQSVPYQAPPLWLDITDLHQWRQRQKETICSTTRDSFGLGPCQIGSVMPPLQEVNMFPSNAYLRKQMTDAKEQENIQCNRGYGCLLGNYEANLKENAYICSRQFFSPYHSGLTVQCPLPEAQQTRK